MFFLIRSLVLNIVPLWIPTFSGGPSIYMLLCPQLFWNIDSIWSCDFLLNLVHISFWTTFPTSNIWYFTTWPKCQINLSKITMRSLFTMLSSSSIDLSGSFFRPRYLRHSAPTEHPKCIWMMSLSFYLRVQYSEP